VKLGYERVSRATPVIPYKDVAVNLERVFSVSSGIGALASGNRHFSLLVTPDKGMIHLNVLDVFTDGSEIGLLVFEGPMVVDDENALEVVPINRFRSSSAVSGVVWLTPVDPAPTGDGIAVVSADDTDNKFTVAGDQTSFFEKGSAFLVAGSSGNDGHYRVLDVEFTDPNTVITVASVADGTNDGELFPLGMVIEHIRFNGRGLMTENLVLKPDTEYLIAIYNDSGDSVDVGFRAIWTEEPRS